MMSTNRWPYYTSLWRNLRRVKLQSVDYTCERCGGNQRLHVHHKEPLTDDQKAMRDIIAGYPPLTKLEVLCLPCHAGLHGLIIRGLDPLEVDRWRDFVEELEDAEQS